MRTFKTLAALSLFLVLTIPLVSGAQQTYFQPIFNEANWRSQTIFVSIPKSPAWAYNQTLFALNVWNEAQQWFVASWYPKDSSAIYTLVNGTGKSQITITYVPDTGQWWKGVTTVRPDSNAASISILLSRNWTTGFGFEYAIMHELGHTLGLSHTRYAPDLMCAILNETRQRVCEKPPSLYPSTLNLYGVYLVAKGTPVVYGDIVTLPSSIPYMEWQPTMTPIPELPSEVGFLAVLVSSLIACVIARPLARHQPRKQSSYCCERKIG
jgi:hypothetical protein